MATVRCYSYANLISAKVNPGGGQYSADSVFMLNDPYLAGEVISPSTSVAASTSAAIAPAETRMLKVQINAGRRCYYEVTPPSQTLRVATDQSPILNGDDLIYFAAGYRLSVLEVSE